jgi:hypothetical protein
MKLAVPVLNIWALLMFMAHDHSASIAVHPVAWLAPPLLQLAHSLLQVPYSSRLSLMHVLNSVVLTASPGFSLPAHPRLSAWVIGRPGDAALGATAAAALRQVSMCWAGSAGRACA